MSAFDSKYKIEQKWIHYSSDKWYWKNDFDIFIRIIKCHFCLAILTPKRTFTVGTVSSFHRASACSGLNPWPKTTFWIWPLATASMQSIKSIFLYIIFTDKKVTRKSRLIYLTLLLGTTWPPGSSLHPAHWIHVIVEIPQNWEHFDRTLCLTFTKRKITSYSFNYSLFMHQ